MQWITGVTVGGGGNFVITGIPQTFTHLQLRATARSSNNAALRSVFYAIPNNDLTLIYDIHYLYGDGASVASNYVSNNQYNAFTVAGSTANTNVYGSVIMDFLDYTNTNKNRVQRSLSGFDNNGSGFVSLTSQLYRSTNAISSLGIYTEGAIASGSRIDLYGITSSAVTGA